MLLLMDNYDSHTWKLVHFAGRIPMLGAVKG